MKVKVMNNSGSIGLSVNVLVVIIISLVILSGGVTLLYKFVKGAEEIGESLDARTEQELERLLVTQGRQVALPFHTTTIEAGNHHIFGIGIHNIDGGEYGNEFKIIIMLSKALDENNIEITPLPNVEEWLLFREESIEIQEGETRKEAILVQVPPTAVKGTYLFKVEVIANEKSYGPPQRFTVIVK